MCFKRWRIAERVGRQKTFETLTRMLPLTGGVARRLFSRSCQRAGGQAASAGHDISRASAVMTGIKGSGIIPPW